MKDSKVGSFGVQALFFITLIQTGCLLKIQNQISYVLPICLFFGRFSNLYLINNFKYISHKKKSISHKKFWRGFSKESFISIIFLILFFTYQLFLFKSAQLFVKNLFLLLIGLLISYQIPKYLGRKIGGFNGDACGASIVIVETAMLFIHAILL